MLRDLMEPLLNNMSPGEVPGDVSNPPALEPILESVEMVDQADTAVPAGEDLRAQFSRHRLLSALVMPNFDTVEALPHKLQTRISDYVFWINLVARLGFDASVYQPLGNATPSLENLSRYFDSTQLGMLRVFHLFDKDHDQTITISEIAHGLRQQGLYTLQGNEDADAAFADLCHLISEEGGFTHPPEFLAALRNLRLAAIVHDRQTSAEVIADDIRLSLHEYREDQLYSACPMEHPVAFFFQAEHVGVRGVGESSDAVAYIKNNAFDWRCITPRPLAPFARGRSQGYSRPRSQVWSRSSIRVGCLYAVAGTSQG